LKFHEILLFSMFSIDFVLFSFLFF